MRTIVVLHVAVLTCALGVGCDALEPPAPPKEPAPGTYLSTPFPGVRALLDVIVLRPGLAYAVGTDGTILKMVDDNPFGEAKGGPNPVWTKEESGTTEDLQAIAGFLRNANTQDETEVLVIVGYNGTVLQRTAPSAWRPVSLPADAPPGVALFSVFLRNDLDGFIVGDVGTILRWDNAAAAQAPPGNPADLVATLTTQLQPATQTVIGGACAVDADCGLNSLCRNTDPDGAGPAVAALLCNTFFAIPEPLSGVSGVDPVFAVGARGAVYTYDAANCTAANVCDTAIGSRTCCWNREDSGTTRTLASVYTRSGGALVPTTDGIILVRGRNANNEVEYADDTRTPAPVFLQDVWVDGGDLFAVGLSQEIFHRDGSGQFFLTTVSQGAEMRGIDGFTAPPDNDPELPPVAKFFAVGGGGRIVRGPFVLPVKGEDALRQRHAGDDFLAP